VFLDDAKCKDQLLSICKSQFQYFVEAGAIAVRRVRKEDLRHVAKATGATVVRLQ
jgi:chaperonin GroEL (HSP60 family)